MATILEMQKAMENYNKKANEVNKKADELLKKAAEINIVSQALPIMAVTKKRKKIFGIF